MAIDPALFGMPDATTAGVQAGVTLTPYSGPMTITTPGTVIENKIIDGELVVKASDVTIKNCSIQSDGWWGIEGEKSPNLHVENCDIVGGNLTNSGILGSGTFVGNDIKHVSIGIQLTNGASTVRDNYVHDLFYGSSDPHYDGITALGGQDHVLIEHNTTSVPQDHGTASILIQNTFGPVNDVTVRDNLMYGDPSYTLYVDGSRTGGPITNVVVENNYAEKGYYGYFSVTNASPIIQNNVQWQEGVDPTPYPSGSVDHFPNAVDDSAVTTAGTPVVIDALANDTLGDTPTTVSSFDATSNHGGTVAFSNGKFTYNPASGWSGVDTFHYAITDIDGDTDSALVSVNVATAPTPGLTLTGTSHADTLQGGAGNDTIGGADGHDWLYGGGGNDTIIGGAGNDDLFGGAGADVFDYNNISETLPGGGQRDFIHDFEAGVDKIDLSTIDANSGLSGDQSFSFLGEGTFSSASRPGLVRYYYETDGDGHANTIIEGTVDTTPGVDFQISLLGHITLTDKDFIL